MKDYYSAPLRARLDWLKRRHLANKNRLGGNATMRDSLRSHLSITPRSSQQNALFALRGGTPCHRWVEDPDDFSKFHGFAHKLLSLRHTGWYVDNAQDETTTGVVYKLPHDRYMAGCTDPWNYSIKYESGPVILEWCIYDDAKSAAHAASSLAEYYAEDCREGDAKDQAEQQIGELETANADLRNAVRELCAGIRASVLSAVVCERLRVDVRKMLTEREANRSRIDKLKDNHWLAVEGW